MTIRHFRWTGILLAGLPFVLAAQQTPPQGPTSDEVFANIKVFKGVPAKDLIPAMEFMSASLRFQCTDCHKADDFAAETRTKETARQMITMQRELNAKYFNNRLEVTCNSCHNGREHPLATPIPEGTLMRHTRIENPPKPEELFQRHIAAVGHETGGLMRTGTMTSPTGPEGKEVVGATDILQASGGRFRVTSTFGKFGSDGKEVWKDGDVMRDEPAAIFDRIGRSWRGEHAFDGLERISVSGKEMVGKATTTVVRGTRTATGSTEELYFDVKSGLLIRFVSTTRSTLGAVITVFDYSDFKNVKGVKVPMKVMVTFAGDEKWTMVYKSANMQNSVDEKAFAPARS